MKAVIEDSVVAESDDIVEERSYAYFPGAGVHLDWLEKAAKTASDLACPHGVQFYDVVIGARRYKRAAWRYEAPRPSMSQCRRPLRLLERGCRELSGPGLTCLGSTE